MLDYGIIGNCVTSALVKKNGSLDWMCYPSFASPSIFAKLLDEKEGGFLDVRPDRQCVVTQQYLENTAILETHFECDDYAFRVIDFFPRYKRIATRKSTVIKKNFLVRLIEPIRGKPVIRVRYDPRLDYARGETLLREEGQHILAENGDLRVTLSTNLDRESLDGREFPLTHRTYLLVGDSVNHSTVKSVLSLFRATREYWLRWTSSLVLPTQNRDLIIRSAITLKLLTYSKTGAIIAAATTSIPEQLGTDRAFDYRYCWIRDAAYTVDALTKIGCGHEAKGLIDFILERIRKDDHIQIMYGINGETDLDEVHLDHLAGFKGMSPVKMGNPAYAQEQHDIYGEVIDIIYLYYVYYRYEERIPKKHWRLLCWLVNQIKFKWIRKDAGIWEFRGGHRHYSYSKLMCYVGVDRAIKVAQQYKQEDSVTEWLSLREKILADLLKNAYNEKRASFTMHYGSDALDASLLHMTYHELLPPTDPRLINTVKRIDEELCTEELVQRYSVEDDFGKSTSSFTICGFWLIDALHYIGEEERAERLFTKLIGHANHLGLFSEDIDIESRKLIGNFPQAYTHIALINTAILLSEWKSKRKRIDWNVITRKSWF